MTTDLAAVRPRTDALRTVLEAAVVVVFALLIWNNFSLRRQARAAAVPSIREHAFVARDYVPFIPTIDLAGKAGGLDLRSGRTTIAIVDPRCDSCREMIATMRSMRGASGIRILSVAPVAETRKMADEMGLAASTTILGRPLPKQIEGQLQIYPQLFIVDHGKVVRTCLSVAECSAIR
jgi:hypothetical protein